MRSLRFASVLVLLLAAVLGCSNYRSLRQAQIAEEEGDWDRAVLEYLELVAQHPGDVRYKAGLLRAKIQASHEHFEKGKNYRDAGLLRQAMIEFQQAVQLDPSNQYALAELGKVRAELEAQREGERVKSIDEMKRRTRESGEGKPPELNPRSQEPIDLDFPEPVSVQKIYQALGKAFGINVLFEPKLRDQDISITLRQVTAKDALEILMRTAGHFYKVLDEHSILVIADTPQNRRTYEDLIIQTFFLSNSSVRDVMTMLRSLVDARKIAANESLNAIILRDTADKVKVAERIIMANDKAKAEVVVEVELLQVNTNRLQDLGLTLDPGYQVGLSLDTGGEDVPLRLSDVEFLDANNWTLTIPNFLFTFIKNATEAQTLARPQLRISEGERARLNIGERVPIPVTSFNTANTVGSNVIPITSFQYQDVGIIIEIEPRVHHNEEVSLQVDVEVSNIAGNVGDQPVIGTRNITTTIRLLDGETNFLAGLLRTDEINSENKLPGLGDLPVLGRLFSKKRSENLRTDLVLTLTPHIIRRADITEEDLRPIWVGTEANITFQGGSPRVESDVEGPFDTPETPEDAREQIRRRIQRLPRGLQGQSPDVQEQPAEEPPPPSGIELVPSAAPRRSPFDRTPEPAEEEPPPDGQAMLLVPEDGDSGPTLVLTAADLEPDDEPTQGPVASTQSASASVLGGLPGKSWSSEGATPPVELELRPAELNVRAGELFELRLDAIGRVPVSHLPSELGFDPSLFELVQVRQGDFLGGAGEAQVLADGSQPGRVVLGASRLGPVAGVAGRGTVAYVTMRALGAGVGSIELRELRALDRDLGRIEPVTGKGSVVLVAEEPRLPDAERPAIRSEP